MSATTFSLMSNPDLLLTIEAYTYMLDRFSNRMISIWDDEKKMRERDHLYNTVKRINELIDALNAEYSKRENS